jgi:hypothetical protein
LPWWEHVVWVLVAGGVGFLVSALFAGWLHLRRELFLVPHAAISGLFLLAYCRRAGLVVRPYLLRCWGWGIVGAAISGIFVSMSVWAQPASFTPRGTSLLLALIWLGGVYGVVDALLLSVMPVIATWNAFSVLGWTKGWHGRLATGSLAVVASAFVTAAYHLGFPEFRGREVMGPVIGNSILTLAYLLSTSPLAAVGGHVAMHVAAVLRGMESTVQLPPHY